MLYCNYGVRILFASSCNYPIHFIDINRCTFLRILAVQMPKRNTLHPTAHLTVGSSHRYCLAWSPPATECQQMLQMARGKAFLHPHETKDSGAKQRAIVFDSCTDEGNAPAFAKVQ